MNRIANIALYSLWLFVDGILVLADIIKDKFKR